MIGGGALSIEWMFLITPLHIILGQIRVFISPEAQSLVSENSIYSRWDEIGPPRGVVLDPSFNCFALCLDQSELVKFLNTGYCILKAKMIF